MVVYSLVCWGGLTGKVVSISASTDVVTLTNHGLRNGAKLWPSGTLPSELNASTPVYARSTGKNTFTLHTSAAGAIANTGQILFAGSSTYAAVTLKSDLVASPSTALAAYGLSNLSRWGSSGSERVYDGLNAFYSARSADTSNLTDEVCELGEDFLNTLSSQLAISVKAASWRITSTINGVRTPAFHYGVINAGFTVLWGTANNTIIACLADRCTLDGFTSQANSSGANLICIDIQGPLSLVNKMIAIGFFVGTGWGIGLRSPAVDCVNSVAIGSNLGIVPYNQNRALRILNCISAFNTTGIQTNNTSGLTVEIYNTVSIGNTTNWTAGFPATASNNAGLSDGGGGYTGGTPVGSSPMALTSSNFVNYTGSGTAPNWTTVPDFRPASGSPAIDAGVVYYGISSYDIADAESPSYNNGGAEYYDVGPYEFDKGFGPHPASHTLTLTNVVVGSRVHIRDQADTVTHYDDIASASSVVIPITVYGDSRDNWRIKVRKASAALYFRPWETIMTATAGSSSIYVSQIPD